MAVVSRYTRGRRFRSYPDLCASKYNKTNLKQGAHIHQTAAGQYLMHAHSYITWVVAAMDSCFALIGAHQHGVAVGTKNGRICVSETLYCRGSSHVCCVELALC